MQTKLQEAERRIEEARRSQWESLDLGDLALPELPASLGNLPHLRTLSLGTYRLTEAGEPEWAPSREPAEFTDLSPLSGLSGLQSLHLGSTGVTDLSPLSGLVGLQSLDLERTGVTDLSPLSGLAGLQNLGLGGTRVTHLLPLLGLSGLQNLDLERTGVTDLSSLSGLSGLQRLNLERTGVMDLSPLAGLSSLQILGLGETGVTNLSPLSGLSGLQSLGVDSTGVTDLSPLASLSGLQILYLGSTRVTDLSTLASLSGLQSLYLWFTEVTDLSPLSGLSGLQSLHLGDTRVTDLSPLSGLSGLQSLHLGNTRVMDLSPLAVLSGLQSLNLDSAGVTDLSPLAGLSGLQILELGGTEVTDLSPLAGLSGLQSLDLAGTGVTDLSPLSGLVGLQNLHLPGTRVTDLSPLSSLSGLQILELGSTGVTDLWPLSSLSGLQSLDLESTGVTDLSPLVGLSDLQSLDLRGTGVTDLSPLSGLSGLQSLYLYGCRPAVPGSLLQVFTDHPRLTELVADQAAGVPREVLSHYPGDNCLPRLRAYLSELKLGAEAETEVKVILLGNSRVGKTQLCRRFRGEEFDESVPSTHGVQIWRQPLRLRVEGQEQVFQVNWWDFGGQDIYHGTHALFLRSRAVFLILWTPGLENRDESEDENGIPLRNQPLAYWLDYVRSLAGEGSPVIVVQSQCDRFADRRPPPARPGGFGFFESCSYSAREKEEPGREALEAHLRDAMRYLLERSGTLEIGQGRAEVRRRLYDWRGEDQERKPEERRHRTLPLHEFRALCEKAGGIASWEHALDYFHQTGVVFYRPDLFSNRIVLDQDWALDAVYAVFHRGRAVPWLRESGRFTREDLAFLVWQEHSLEEQKLFLGLMESCGVCFPCGKTARGEARYVAPDLLPGFEAAKSRLHAWREDAETPVLRLEYRFFHPAVIRGLMSDIAREAGDLAEYWKYGLWFKDGQRDSQIFVRFEDTSTGEAPGAGALELKAQGRDPLGLLREIRQAILRDRIGEEPKEVLTLAGTTVARSALASGIAGQVLDLAGKPVSAAPFAAFFQDPGHDPDQARAAGELPAIDVKPQAPTETEKPREVFLSYAWGDKTPAGKDRSAAIEGLCTALAADGFRPVRDRDEIRSGERISAFIRRLTRADLVVAVISDKYLRSPYCMYEIYRLWQRFQADADLLVEHLVPLVLPEVRIGSLEDRAPYVKHWRKRLTKLKALIRELGLDAGRESYEEARLVNEFVHHVDSILYFLHDIYMPRDLEADLADGFQAVRDALRKRIGTAP